VIGDLGSVVGVAIGVVLFFAGAALVVVKRLFHICSPNEVLVFSGGKSNVEGRPVGYRIVKGGSSLRTPLLERVDRMDITNMTVDVAVSNAYSKGGIPLTVAGVANLKVAGHQPLLNNALERLLGKGRPQIIQVAKDTLEGNLRGVLSQLTPEEVNQDKLRFAEKLLEEAEHDLSRLGLVLDVLKIQNVADDVGYLNSLGRKQTAALDKSARVAEAEAHAEATMREAENGLAARLSLIEAEAAIARAEADKRIMQCETGREAMVAEAVGKVTTAIARAEAELKVQQARLPQVRLQLEADVVAPARADMEKRQAEARGKAAKIVEDGKATAAVLTQMIEAWKAAGPNARDIFLMQKLQTVMSSLVETIQNVSVDRVAYLPASSQVTQGVQLVEQVKAAFGVDLAKVVAQLGAPGGATPAHLAAASVANSPTLPANASDGTAAPSTRPRT
jgi:flotillin